MTTSAPVVGVVGNDVPRQLLVALGAQPYRLTGTWTGAIDPAAQQLLGASDATAARILSELRNGVHAVDAIIVCNDNQAHLRLFYVLRATAPELPLHLLDMPRDDSEPARGFARFQLDALVAFCERLTGRRLDEGSLAVAAAAEAALGDALRRLRARRRADPPMCSGAEALEAYVHAARLPPHEATERVEAAQTAVPSGAMRVHVTGSSHPDATVYRLLEGDGRCVVVSEDHDTGDGAWLGEAVDGETVERVLEGLIDAHFGRVTASATTSSADRAAITRDVARSAGADAVVALIRELDEAPMWDLADQLVALEGTAPLVSVRVPPGGEADAARQVADALIDGTVQA